MTGPPLSRRRFLAAGGLLLLGCATARPAARTSGASGGAASNANGEAGAALVRTEPILRVGLAVAAADVHFQTLGGRYLVHERDADEPIAVVADGETWGVTARGAGDVRVVDPRGYLSQPHARPIRIEPLGSASTLRIGEASYAGSLEVFAGAGGFTVVNELPLEEYLRGVLARELPAGPEAFEALKAQGVAARTYALKRTGSRAELGFDVFADVQDQVYGGAGAATAAVDRALAETRGLVLLAGGNLVDAYYHSTCGGSTAALEEAFPEPAVPYLRSVDDGDGVGGFHCARSRYFRWQASYEAVRLEALLARNLARFVALPTDGPGALLDVSITETSPRGRVLALRIETTTGNYQVSRNDVRWLFADESSPGLRSTLFLLRKERRRDVVASITLTGGGWGHGVGMCQMGALGRAAAGERFDEILATYYAGTRLESLYA